MLAWKHRPLESATLLNPVFTCALITQSCHGFGKESARAMPIPLAFLTLPIVLHRDTRNSLPQRVSSHLANWALTHKALRLGLRARVNHLLPYTREALVLGISRSIVRVSGDATILPCSKSIRESLPRLSSYLQGSTPEVRECFARSKFLGRWLSRSGDTTTVFQTLGMTF